MLSIVAVVINNLEVSRRFVSSIRQYTRGKYELILLDNASTDKKAIRFFRRSADKYFRFETMVSLSQAWNKGIVISKGEYVAVANNDTVVPLNWFAPLKQVLDSNKKAGMVHPLTFWLLGAYLKQKMHDRMYKNFSQPYRLRRFKELVWGEFMVFKRAALDMVGGFNEIYKKLHCEDLEMVFQLYKHGYDIFVDPRVFVYHEGSASHKAGIRPTAELNSIRQKNWELFLSRWPQYTKGWK